MYLAHSGTVELNQPLTKEAIDQIAKIDHLDGAFTQAEVGDDEFVAEEEGRHFGENLNLVINALKPLGYIANGVVEYWGDYEGKLYVEDNEVKDRDISQVGFYEATDEELVEALTQRVYKVTLKKL